MFEILCQNDQILVIQTHAGEFDKWGDDIYGQFNMGMHVGDDSERVLINRANLLTALNELTHHQITQIHWLNQIHGDEVICADDACITPKNGDALMTDKKGVALSIMTADCVPIALFDDMGGQIACIHAGWQGLVKGIIKNTAQQFDHNNIKAVIGACISQTNYEIDKTLANNIVSNVIEKNLVNLTFDELYQTIIVDKDNDKCLIDIVKLTQLQLAHLNITVMNDKAPCSYATPNLYSYRQQTHAKKHATGRLALVVARY